jgi:hypothetical protein
VRVGACVRVGGCVRVGECVRACGCCVRVGSACVWVLRACGCVRVCVGHKIFFVCGKTYNGTFLGIFRRGLYLFDPKIALRDAQDRLWVKKVSARKKNPSKCPIYVLPAKHNLLRP